MQDKHSTSQTVLSLQPFNQIQSLASQLSLQQLQIQQQNNINLLSQTLLQTQANGNSNEKNTLVKSCQFIRPACGVTNFRRIQADGLGSQNQIIG
ncbi:UNKNOWN [Stylonychia lemnae]|uniref:Uncharacterized protein n=1 Tax=Stylonychia lemnae TaxID=5949 RepID=A0A078A2R8_STYLE|nr:UNKNOWN [Stylonychia lemnae]|eukprot:CDW75079.1 UNKNOWN [Stylonychia lemnae]